MCRYLRCQMPRRKRYGSYDQRGCIPNQVSIDEHPASDDALRCFGDRGGNTVIGKGHQGALSLFARMLFWRPVMPFKPSKIPRNICFRCFLLS